MPISELTLRFKVKSDAIFGSAERSESGIDIDIQHDRWGFPYLPGRTLKGLLRERCADIMDNLTQAGKIDFKENEKTKTIEEIAVRLFGVPGSGTNDLAILRFRNAQLLPTVREPLMQEVDNKSITSREVLDALTTLRKQTAMDGWSGVARDKSLRVMRVILRGTVFESKLVFQEEPTASDLSLLAACLKAFRRAGTNRTRGSGELHDIQLLDEKGNDLLPDYFGKFSSMVKGGVL